ncbi:hypothetical protein HMPREF3289_15940 [Pseudomonas sp. HMSC75E02]|nr:hypothetical protein A9Z48_29805 [Pseudomonas aeruginosa]OFM73543.1 hypothetical protein HMPREF2670_19610 [Pseudomonas sp. HMSC072F09]OHS00393.1 hypothetical protein HMPREF3289_15940 [Pseudomonas sp. HMSC75E02]PCK60863.1 hypothetical protein A2J12_26325 [Pseudomonas aeruginosa]
MELGVTLASLWWPSGSHLLVWPVGGCTSPKVAFQHSLACTMTPVCSNSLHQFSRDQVVAPSLTQLDQL